MTDTDGAAGGETHQGQSLVGRIMMILDCFRNASGPLNLTSISRRTGLPVSTTHRLLSELTKWGALKKTSQGYLVSLKLFEISLHSYEHERLQQIALPTMQDVYSLTRANVHLSVLDGYEVVFIGKMIGRNIEAMRTRVGGRMPAITTASGRALLAHQAAVPLQEMIDISYQKFAKRTLPDRPTLLRQISQAAREHFSSSTDEFREGMTAMASPIFRGDGEAVAALSIVGPTEQLSSKQLPSLTRNAAKRISRQMESAVEAQMAAWDG